MICICHFTCNRICFLRNLVRREVFDLHLCLRNLYTRTLLSVSLLLQSLELNYFLDKTIGWRWNAWGSTWGIIVYRMIPLPWRPFPILSLKEQSNPLSLILGFPSTHYRHNRQTTKSKERPGKQLWSTVSPSIFHYFIKIIHCIVPSFFTSKSTKIWISHLSP